VTSTIYQWNHGYGTRTQLQVNRSWSQDVQATSRRLPFKTCWLIGPLPQIKQLGLQETCQQQPQLRGQCDKFFVFFWYATSITKASFTVSALQDTSSVNNNDLLEGS